MKVMKKPLICGLTLIIALCSSLFGCEKSYDDIMANFIYENGDGEFNAIKIEIENEGEAVYFIDESYGLWITDKETIMFNIYHTLHTQSGGDLIINKFSALSYYKAIVEYSDPKSAGYYGDVIFSGYAQFSKDGTLATFSPDNVHINEMSSKPEAIIKMTKRNLSASEIIPFDVALRDMNFVPDAYNDFVSDRDGWKFSCEIADFWVDGSTMTGEWNTNGSIIPIRMKLHEKVPYIEIYDISGSSEKLILKSFANVVDGSSIELLTPEGEMFYTTPSASVIITKTN